MINILTVEQLGTLWGPKTPTEPINTVELLISAQVICAGILA